MPGDFEPHAVKMREAGLPELAIRAFELQYAKLAAGDRGLLPESEIQPVDSLPGLAEAAEGSEVAERGTRELARAVVIKLNGGLGTSMGMTRAKSLLRVKHVDKAGEIPKAGDGLCFLDVVARQVVALGERAGTRVPLLLMDSFRTRDDSLAVLARYPELSDELPADFLQHKVPRIDARDLSPVFWPEAPELEWCPPGHGDLYTALVTSGCLVALREAGRRWAFISNADNLGAVLDPALLGWFCASGAPFAMEVCDRSPAHRKGGHLARSVEGRLLLREIAQCPEADLDSFQDIERHRFFNTNNLWIDLEALAASLAERDGLLDLPLIVNEKPVDPADPGSLRVIQLESAMGAAIAVFPGSQALRVPGSRFAPVKTTSELLAVRSDAFVLDADHRVVPAPGRGGAPLVVDLDTEFFRTVPELEARFPHGAPSLAACRRLRVRGDVVFGRGVVCEGEVEIEAPPGGRRVIPDGARLDA